MQLLVFILGCPLDHLEAAEALSGQIAEIVRMAGHQATRRF
jgi:hypothetical protein